jgi:hypothetical protein
MAAELRLTLSSLSIWFINQYTPQGTLPSTDLPDANEGVWVQGYRAGSQR